MSSPRKDVLDTLMQAASTVRNARYWTHRGAVNWAIHDFKNKPRGLAVMLDRSKLWPTATTLGRPGDFTLELFATIPEPAAQVDDAVMDELYEDAATVIDSLIGARNAMGDAVAYKVERASAETTEVHDFTLKVQGLIVTFGVTY